MDRHSAELVSHLAQQPAWKALQALAEEKKTAKANGLARKIASGTQLPDLMELRYLQGVFKGMDILLNAPKNALSELDRIGDTES